MATPVTIPSLGEDVPAAVLIRFLVEEGSSVRRGDALYELDTDKVTQEVEAEADGVLLQVVGTAGVEYPVGATIAWIGDTNEQPPPKLLHLQPRQGGSGLPPAPGRGWPIT